MLQCCVRWQQCLHRTRPFCCKFSPFHKYSFSSENGFSVFPFWEKSASLNCVFESSLPSHTNTRWWEYVHTGIQHRDLIVIKNLRFHPSTRIQQIDIFKKPPLWREFLKRCVFVERRFHRIRVDAELRRYGRPNRRRNLCFHAKTDTCKRVFSKGKTKYMCIRPSLGIKGEEISKTPDIRVNKVFI